jgi:hypothetical protein
LEIYTTANIRINQQEQENAMDRTKTQFHSSNPSRTLFPATQALEASFLRNRKTACANGQRKRNYPIHQNNSIDKHTSGLSSKLETVCLVEDVTNHAIIDFPEIEWCSDSDNDVDSSTTVRNIANNLYNEILQCKVDMPFSSQGNVHHAKRRKSLSSSFENDPSPPQLLRSRALATNLMILGSSTDHLLDAYNRPPLVMSEPCTNISLSSITSTTGQKDSFSMSTERITMETTAAPMNIYKTCSLEDMMRSICSNTSNDTMAIENSRHVFDRKNAK